jgi:hypothetical protein
VYSSCCSLLNIKKEGKRKEKEKKKGEERQEESEVTKTNCENIAIKLNELKKTQAIL